MLLSQEYLQRYGLSCPVVFRPEKESAFSFLFQQQGTCKWVLLQICNKVPNHGPPYYNVDWSQPSYNSGHNFTHLTPSIRLEWDEYEREIASLLSGFTNMEPVSDPQQLSLLCWEIFLFCNDEAVASLPIATQKSFWAVIDARNTVDVRLDKLSQCKDMLPRYKNLQARYQAIKGSVCDKNAGWLHDIVCKARTDPQFADSFTQMI